MRWIKILWLQFLRLMRLNCMMAVRKKVRKIPDLIYDVYYMRLTDPGSVEFSCKISIRKRKMLLCFRFNLLKLRSDGSRLNEPLDIIAAIEKSVPFFDAAAAAAAAAAATAAAAAVELPQWFAAPSNMIANSMNFPFYVLRFRCTKKYFSSAFYNVFIQPNKMV